MRRGEAHGGRSIAAALVVLAAIAVPVAVVVYAALSTTSSSGGQAQAADPPVLAPPPAPVGRRGIPLGPPKLPEELYGLFSGTKLAVSPESAVAALHAARAKSMRVFIILVGSQRHYKSPEGSFDLDRWKATLDEFRGVDLAEFVADRTIVAHQLVSEAKARGQWNGTVIPNNVLDEMARYSKEVWPTMPTVLRTDPSDLEEHAAAFGVPWPGWKWRYLDAASARYLARKGSVDAFASSEQASATRQRLALVTGLNVLSGGDGSSGLPSPRSGMWAMSPEELRRYGSALLLRTTPCAFELWRYETPGSAFEDYHYFRRREIAAAVTELAAIASRRPARPCRRRPG